MNQPSYKKEHCYHDLGVRLYRDAEEPVKQEDEHGGDVVEEDVVPGSHSHKNHKNQRIIRIVGIILES